MVPGPKMAITIQKSRQLRSACDRCYELKERCARASPVASCIRCDRLDLDCLTVRPVKKGGRRAKSQRQPAPATNSEKSSPGLQPFPPDIATLLDTAPELPREEKDLLGFFLGQSDSIECYLACPSFQAAEQQFLMAQLPTAWPILKDAYLACASALKQRGQGAETECHSIISLQHASLAMNTLRSLPVTNSQDAALCVTLGTVLALSVYSTIGVGVADICRHTLEITGPFSGDLTSDAPSEPQKSFLILLETMECLVHRRRPTVRMSPNIVSVDRHIGLCLPLLPYLYDLCVISHSLADVTNTADSTHLQRQLDEIQMSLEDWQPPDLDQLTSQFGPADIVNLLAQAKVYRLAALLVGHRLRHSFGHEDGQASVWSKEITMELNMARQITKRPIRCVTLPYLIAALEVRDPGARIKTLQNVEEFVDRFTPVVQKSARTFLLRVWEDRDLEIGSCWFDSICKPCPVVGSIEVNCFPYM